MGGRNDHAARNARVGRIVLGIVVFMVALSFASVPLYRVFCAKTGFDGTVQIGGKAPGKATDRTVTILFDARVDSGLPWDFRPETPKMTVAIGQQGVVSFRGSNIAAKTTTGTAVYNVTPEKAGAYFHKTQCFCFAQQSLGPGKSADFPVVFYLDPAMLQDREMDDVTDVTLSYTFYATDSKALDKVLGQ